MLSSAALVTWLVTGLGAVPLRAQDAPRMVSYCAAEGAESRAALASLRALEELVDDPTASVETVADRYRELVASPCFVSMGDGEAPLASRAAMYVWWHEGGQDWLWHFAHGRGAGAFDVRLPPSPRPTLSLESSPTDHPLRALLCSEVDAACGLETAGWALRAAEAFEAHAARDRERERMQAAEADADQDVIAEATQEGRIAQCARAVNDVPSAERFPRWRACVSAARDQTSVLPVGRIHAPTRGWLVLRGRRGHYAYCDELRAYDLATGAAHLASRCGRLLGGVPQETLTVTSGRVPIDALREAAWMLLLADLVDRHHVSSLEVSVPANVPSRWDPNVLAAQGRGSGWGSSAQTRLDWAWAEGSRVLARGTLTWPDSDRAAESHAASLVRIAEAALAPGCAPAILPRGLALGTDTLGVSPVDADAETLRRTADALEVALRAARAPRCR
ncbi:MAG: hypothetical protein J0L92_10290 [Deltaproteobacteria bacterium]|nr:hypothetical protein [Deltaproteobacteria bacterium]